MRIRARSLAAAIVAAVSTSGPALGACGDGTDVIGRIMGMLNPLEKPHEWIAHASCKAEALIDKSQNAASGVLILWSEKVLKVIDHLRTAYHDEMEMTFDRIEKAAYCNFFYAGQILDYGNTIVSGNIREIGSVIESAQRIVEGVGGDHSLPEIVRQTPLILPASPKLDIQLAIELKNASNYSPELHIATGENLVVRWTGSRIVTTIDRNRFSNDSMKLMSTHKVNVDLIGPVNWWWPFSKRKVEYSVPLYQFPQELAQVTIRGQRSEIEQQEKEWSDAYSCRNHDGCPAADNWRRDTHLSPTPVAPSEEPWKFGEVWKKRGGADCNENVQNGGWATVTKVSDRDVLASLFSRPLGNAQHADFRCSVSLVVGYWEFRKKITSWTSARAPITASEPITMRLPENIDTGSVEVDFEMFDGSRATWPKSGRDLPSYLKVDVSSSKLVVSADLENQWNALEGLMSKQGSFRLADCPR